MVGKRRREDPEILNVIIVRSDDEIKPAAQTMCGLGHMLAKGKLREKIEESGGDVMGRIL
jgi:hypothetical protein